MAEQLLLKALGEQLLHNEGWKKAVVTATRQAWEQTQKKQPDARKELEQSLASIKQKIQHLLDVLEDGDTDPAIRERLTQRQQERSALERKLRSLQHSDSVPPEPPTESWILKQLQEMQQLLVSGGPAAAKALRSLLDGPLMVTCMPQARGKRNYFQGRLVLKASYLTKQPGKLRVQSESAEISAAGLQELIIDFRESDPVEIMVDQVKELWDQGLLYREIAKRIGWNRNLVAEALARWHRQHGLPHPDGRKCKKRLRRKTIPQQVADRVKDLWDQGKLMEEIAETLHCTRDTVTKAIQHWYGSRNLEIPDGRTRRKNLSYKVRSKMPPATEAIAALPA